MTNWVDEIQTHHSGAQKHHSGVQKHHSGGSQPVFTNSGTPKHQQGTPNFIARARLDGMCWKGGGGV